MGCLDDDKREIFWCFVRSGLERLSNCSEVSCLFEPCSNNQSLGNNMTKMFGILVLHVKLKLKFLKGGKWNFINFSA